MKYIFIRIFHFIVYTMLGGLWSATITDFTQVIIAGKEIDEKKVLVHLIVAKVFRAPNSRRQA
jgi:hypothetical protein